MGFVTSVKKLARFFRAEPLKSDWVVGHWIGTSENKRHPDDYRTDGLNKFELDFRIWREDNRYIGEGTLKAIPSSDEKPICQRTSVEVYPLGVGKMFRYEPIGEHRGRYGIGVALLQNENEGVNELSGETLGFLEGYPGQFIASGLMKLKRQVCNTTEDPS